MKYMSHGLPSPTILDEVKAVLHLAIPLAGAQLSQSATGFVDTVMMGFLGSQTIAAGGLGATYFTALLLISSAVMAAVSPLAAEAHGAGKPERVGQVARQGLWLAVALSIPLTWLLWNAALVLRLLGQAPETIALSQIYLRAIAWGLLPGLGFAVLRSFVAALSDARPIIVIMIGGTLINIVTNYGLMFGIGILPQLGLAGLGWASTLSLWCMFLALVGYILNQPQLRAYGVFRHLHRFDQQIFGELIKIGIPMGVLSAVEVGLFAVTTVLMGQLGTVALAAHQIAIQTAAITFTIPTGIGLATTVQVGQLIGQGNFKRAKRAGFIGIALGCLFMSSMAILFWTMPGSIVALYLDIRDPLNAEVVELAKRLLLVAAMFQLADGIQVTATGALRGFKDTQIPMLIGLATYWGVGLTSGYVLGLTLGFGGVGLWWGLALGLAVAAILLTWRFWAKQPNRQADGLDKF